MFCHEEHALQLAALALQADRGDRTAGPASRTPHFRLEDYVPARVSGWLHATLTAPSATCSLLLSCSGAGKTGWTEYRQPAAFNAHGEVWPITTRGGARVPQGV